MERKGKFVLSPPSGTHDWWEINDMEKMYAVVSIQSSFPGAEQVAHDAWSHIGEQVLASE